MTTQAQPSLEEWLTFVMRSPQEFSIQYPPRPEFFMEHFATRPPRDSSSRGAVPKLLYVHIPFCLTKCAYCLFATDSRTEPQGQCHS